MSFSYTCHELQFLTMKLSFKNFSNFDCNFAKMFPKQYLLFILWILKKQKYFWNNKG